MGHPWLGIVEALFIYALIKVLSAVSKKSMLHPSHARKNTYYFAAFLDAWLILFGLTTMAPEIFLKQVMIFGSEWNLSLFIGIGAVLVGHLMVRLELRIRGFKFSEVM